MIKQLRVMFAHLVSLKNILTRPVLSILDLLSQKLLVQGIFMMGSVLLTTSVWAHPGHLKNGTMHSFLHPEHVMGFAALTILAFVVLAFRQK